MGSPRVSVAVWVSSFDTGGTERQMLELLRGFDRNRFGVHAVCFAARGPWLFSAAECAASLAEFPIDGFFRSATCHQLRRYAQWCRAREVDVVITSDFYTNVFGLAGAALARVPVRIGGRREINTDKTPSKLALQRAAYATAHCVVANSRAAADRLASEGVARSKIAVIGNGVRRDGQVADRTGRPIRTVLTVANLRAEKGHAVLLEAIAAGRDAFENIEFVFAGDGPCRAALEAQARELAIDGQIRFLGERHDIPALLAQADLFVLPSLTEAFPNSLLEAMAAGLPVIATRTGGIGELVEDGATGVLVAPGDSGALRDAIKRAMENPDPAAAMARAAAAIVGERHSFERMTSEFSALIDTLIAGTRERAHASAVPVSQ
jgi:glycosyltransferase involved in cell wall biosynthesis